MMRDDRGAAALLIAAGMVLFLGMAALAVDVGLLFNERRQDQSAADSGVMAGALSAVNGPADMVTNALFFSRDTLDTTYSAGEWQTLWEGCVDPAAERNAGGFNFVALNPPAGWTASDPANWCMSIDSSESLFRVRLPQQIVEARFGGVLGVNQLDTHAFAVALIDVGAGGVLPFGLPAGAGDGGQICLSDAPGGLALDPCDGPATGNFGTLKGRKFGSSTIPTNPNCNAAPLGQVLAQNIAHGYDHLIAKAPDDTAANEIRDLCTSPPTVNTLETDPGFPGMALENGLVGPVPNDGPYSYQPKLALSGPTIDVFGHTVNDEPL